MLQIVVSLRESGIGPPLITLIEIERSTLNMSSVSNRIKSKKNVLLFACLGFFCLVVGFFLCYLFLFVCLVLFGCGFSFILLQFVVVVVSVLP